MEGTDYSGVASLAQASLALNIAYLSLDRFRYKKRIENYLAQALEEIGEDDGSDDDMAWKHLRQLATGKGNVESWGNSAFGYRCNKWIFHKAIDRGVCYVLSALSLFVLYTNAYDALIQNTDMTAMFAKVIYVSDEMVNFIIFAFLVLGTLVPLVFLRLGTYTTGIVESYIEQCKRHLASKQKTVAEMQVKNYQSGIAA